MFPQEYRAYYIWRNTDFEKTVDFENNYRKLIVLKYIDAYAEFIWGCFS